MSGRLIYGGSFNPLHIGHLRLALGALDLMAGIIDIVEFLPSAAPPHKKLEPMLPFSMRAAMIRATINGEANLACNEMEAGMPAPSYTFDTLAILAEKYGKENIFFLLGSADFALLPEWHKGLELPGLSSLVIAPRGQYSQDEFAMQARKFWPDSLKSQAATQDECTGAKVSSIEFACGTAIYLLQLPYLAISATEIRKLWLCGKNLDYLVPAPALKILSRRQQTARACWQERTCSK